MSVIIFLCDLSAICIYNSLQPLGDGCHQLLAEHLVCLDLLSFLLYYTVQMGLVQEPDLLHLQD